MGQIVLPLMAGISEQWASQHSDRIRSGLTRAAKEGRFPGRPKAKIMKLESEIVALIADGGSEIGVAKALGVSPKHVQNVKRKHGLVQRRA